MIKKKLILSLSLLLLAGSISGGGKEKETEITETTTAIATEAETETETEATTETESTTEEEPATEEIAPKDEDEVVNEYMSVLPGTWVSEGTLGKESYTYTYSFSDDLSWSVCEERSDGRIENHSGVFYCIMKPSSHEDNYFLYLFSTMDKYNEYMEFEKHGGTYYGGEDDLEMLISSVSEDKIKLHNTEFVRTSSDYTPIDTSSSTTEEYTPAVAGERFEMVRGGSYFVPEGFDNITQETYAVRYVQEWQNYSLDMYITVTNCMQHDIPITLDEEYASASSQSDNRELSLDKKEADGYILSGTYLDTQRIFYQKVKNVEDRYVSFYIEYPASNADTCNKILEDFVANFDYYN